jgi:hypothetical protein
MINIIKHNITQEENKKEERYKEKQSIIQKYKDMTVKTSVLLAIDEKTMYKRVKMKERKMLNGEVINDSI